MIIALDFGYFLIYYLFIGILDAWVEPFSHFLEHLDKCFFSKFMLFDLILALDGLGSVNISGLEFLEELYELYHFMRVFNEVSLNDQAQKLNEHEVFWIQFTDRVVDILYDFFVVGGSMMIFLLFGQLNHQL